MKDVIILGAGITGLTAAHHLDKRKLDFLVLDPAGRVGGVIQSVTSDGFLYEEGPNSGVVANVEVLRLFDDLAGECELEVARGNVSKRYVLKDGRWEPLPGGLKSAVTTPLFTLKDKFRVLAEPFRARGKNPDETLAELVKRRLGASFLDYAIDPFIIGVYAGDPARLVPRHALPKLYNLEQTYGSFIGGSVKKQFTRKTEEEKRVKRNVFSVKGGLSTLIKALAGRIGEERISLKAAGIRVNPVGDHWEVAWTGPDGNLRVSECRQVISTVGAYALPELLPFADPQQLKKITALHYTRVIEVVIGFRRWKGMSLDAFGALIPFAEKRDLLGVLFMSSLFSGRAPEGGALFSVFMAGVRRPDIYQLPDDKVVEVLSREFCDLMKLDSFDPDLLKIIRHEHAIPQYEADSGERFRMVEELEKQYPGLIIGGNLRNGIGMADRIQQAKYLADAVRD